MNHRIGFTSLILSGFMVASNGEAALITSHSRASFQAALMGGSLSSEDFDGIAAGTILGVTPDVIYSASAGSPIVTRRFLTSTSPHGLGSTSIGGLDFFLFTETAGFSFTSAITAFAIDINTFATLPGSYTATLGIGDVVPSIFEVFPGTGTGQFLGFTSDTPFTTVTIAPGGFSYTLDTLLYGDAAALMPSVPEPSTVVLLVLGLAGLGFRRKA